MVKNSQALLLAALICHPLFERECSEIARDLIVNAGRQREVMQNLSEQDKDQRKLGRKRKRADTGSSMSAPCALI